MLIDDRHAPLEPADPITISYTLIRHLGFMLDELSAQGLLIWQDQGQCWCWAWAETAFHSERGFWSIGEAIVDAVVTHFPAASARAAVRRASKGSARRRSSFCLCARL